MKIRKAIGAASIVGLVAVLTSCSIAEGGPGGGEPQGDAFCVPEETGPGVTEDTIRLGSLMPLTGAAAPTGIATKEGQEAYFNYVNEAGGIDGRNIELTILDDEYDPSLAQNRIRQLLDKEDILFIAGGYGTPAYLAAAQYIEEQGVPAVAPYSPSTELGTLDMPHTFMAAVDYIKEFKILSDFVLDGDESIEKVALVGVAGNVGEDSLKGIETAIEESGRDIEVKYVPTEVGVADYGPIVSNLKQFGAQKVFMILTIPDTGAIINAMRNQAYEPGLVAWAGMSDDAYIEEFGDVSQGMVVALETADLQSEKPLNQEFVKVFTEQMQKAPTKFNQLGWVQAMLSVEAIKRAEGLSRGCIYEALETFENVETDIYPPISWSSTQRAGVDTIGIAVIEGDQLRVIRDVDEG